MPTTKPYMLTILLHPQTSPREQEEVESTVRTWVDERKGTVTTVTHDQKRRLAYPIRHVTQATYTTVRFAMPPENLRDLREKLGRQKKVLRIALHQREARIEGKTLKDVPLRPAAVPEKAPPAAPKKEKASLEKLDEKIEEILGEEVL